jgi:hypothetical protein
MKFRYNESEIIIKHKNYNDVSDKIIKFSRGKVKGIEYNNIFICFVPQ